MRTRAVTGQAMTDHTQVLPELLDAVEALLFRMEVMVKAIPSTALLPLREHTDRLRAAAEAVRADYAKAKDSDDFWIRAIGGEAAEQAASAALLPLRKSGLIDILPRAIRYTETMDADGQLAAGLSDLYAVLKKALGD